MVFLNGCYTAIGDDKKRGFLGATAYRGLCGFVGTEAKIPDVFALRFANHFLAQLLYSGKTAGVIMHGMRLQHWPLSLIYNLSCHPGFCFLKSAQVPPIPTMANLSGDVIGSERV